MSDFTLTQQSALSKRLDEAENPDWYLTLFGTALEVTDDFDRSLLIADAAAAEEPHPPPSEEDAELQRVEDALALAGGE